MLLMIVPWQMTCRQELSIERKAVPTLDQGFLLGAVPLQLCLGEGDFQGLAGQLTHRGHLQKVKVWVLLQENRAIFHVQGPAYTSESNVVCTSIALGMRTVYGCLAQAPEEILNCGFCPAQAPGGILNCGVWLAQALGGSLDCGVWLAQAPGVILNCGFWLAQAPGGMVDCGVGVAQALGGILDCGCCVAQAPGVILNCGCWSA